MRYRFSTDFVLCPTADGAVSAIALHNGAVIRTDAWLISLIGALHQLNGFTREDFCTELDRIKPDEPADVLFLALIATRAIKAVEPEQKRKLGGPGRVAYPWDELGWATARLFHDAVLHSSFLLGDAQGRRMQSVSSELISETGHGPPITKSYPERDFIELPRPTEFVETNFRKVLLGRRTRRNLRRDFTLSLQAVATLLHYGARMQGSLWNKWFGHHLLRTSPSGGARHPVDVYPQLLRVSHSSPGNYYYDPILHRLFRLGETTNDLIYRVSQSQEGANGAALALLISARFSRNLWKYRYSKSYIFTLFDVGHLVQTVLLCAEALGLRSFLTPAIDVELAHQHLGFDNPYDECAVYLVTLG